MKRLLLTTLLLSMTALSGCYKDMIVVDKGYNPAKRTPDAEAGRLYILGFGIGEPVSLDRVCPGGAGIVQTKDYFNLPWYIIPLSLVSYSHSAVYCKGA